MGCSYFRITLCALHRINDGRHSARNYCRGYWRRLNLALVTAGILITIEIAIGQFIEPLLFGKMTGLSPVAIVASAAFWTALWGPIGLIIATPLTVGLLVVGRNIDSLDFLEVLFGNEPALSPDHALYQRLLASDSIEAAELADKYIKNDHLDVFMTDVAVPSLLLANYDQMRGVLSLERQTSVVHSFSEMLDDLIPVTDKDLGQTASIVLISPPGVLNFAATLAFSALLKLKDVPHLMLDQDAIAPGKIPKLVIQTLKRFAFVTWSLPAKPNIIMYCGEYLGIFRARKWLGLPGKNPPLAWSCSRQNFSCRSLLQIALELMTNPTPDLGSIGHLKHTRDQSQQFLNTPWNFLARFTVNGRGDKSQPLKHFP